MSLNDVLHYSIKILRRVKLVLGRNIILSTHFNVPLINPVYLISGVPRSFVRGGGVQQIQLRTERTGSGGSSSLVRGSGGSCNLVQKISFHIVTFS